MNSFKKLLLRAGVLVSLFACATAPAQEDQYVQIYNQIQEGDATSSEQSILALNKYLKAQSDLQQFQKLYPEWNPRIVTFRLNYLVGKIADLSRRTPNAPAPATPGIAPKPTTTPAVPAPMQTEPATPAQPSIAQADIAGQLNALRDQIHQLQSDNALLQAKVREAFAAQPAAVDSRELEKADNQIKSLQKENVLLKVTLDQTKTAKPGDPKEVERLKKQIADANGALSEQTSRANSLAQEKLALQNQLLSLSSTAGGGDSTALKKSLEESTRKLNEQLKFAALLQADKASLQRRVADLSAEAEASAALRAENALLKKQVSELKLTAGNSTETARKLAEAQAQIAALQSDKEMLRLDKLNLQQQVKQLTLANATISQSADVVRVKQLQRERNDLQGRLNVAENELSSRRNKAIGAQMDQLRSQVDTLQTRLAVFQAPAVPYSKEELALFANKPEQMSVAVNPGFEKKSSKELPAGTLAMVNDAQRDFALGRYSEAESKYLQVLKQDDKNVYTLANLAAIQLELNHLDDAEKHVTQALAISPDDPYSLSILGNLKFRQGKTDDAFDALAHAAKVDPKNAEIQNHLGLVLSQKGLRKEAENALRTAVELDPNYASAHNNLAVIYITQKPPSPALARWHYEKARALGMPANAQLEKMLDQNSATASATSQQPQQ